MLRTFATFLIATLLASPLLAQDTKPAATDAKTETKTTEAPKTEAPKTEAKPAESAGPSPEEAAFNKAFDKWKEFLGKIKNAQVDYKSAKPEERQAIRDKFNQLIKEGEALEPELKKAAEAAFAAAPNKNKEVSDVLTSMVIEDFDRDKYDEALKRAKFLIDHKFANARIEDYAGKAAFYANKGDDALKYLKLADEHGALESDDRPMIKEQEIRNAEAKANDLPRVELKTTKGKIVVELFENEAPNTVANFISLVEKKFYDGLSFHRVLEGFMAQGGDPKGDGSGGPGYTIEDECTKPNHRLHFRGSLSMAKKAEPNTGGSQFFLNFVRTPHLDGKHTVFGRIIEGFDVLDSLQRRNPDQPNAPAPDRILEAKVLRKRDHKYEPKTTPEKS
jgi:cyclophilin family peptidyl-prolyl cis-trans isomerase